MSYLFLIPARGGSKRIKNKNLIKINRKPLIDYTLNVCKKFKNIDTVISTDNNLIRNHCIKKGFFNVEISYQLIPSYFLMFIRDQKNILKTIRQ